jgi:hypothetical protein
VVVSTGWGAFFPHDDDDLETTQMKLTLDEARVAVRDQAQKVFDEDPYKERLALVTDESRASGIKEAIEKAAEAMAAFYEQQAMYDPPGSRTLAGAARAHLRNVLDDMLGIRAEHAAGVKQERDRKAEEAAEKERVAAALRNPEGALLEAAKVLSHAYVQECIKQGFAHFDDNGEIVLADLQSLQLTDDLRAELESMRDVAADVFHIIDDRPDAKSAPFPIDALGPMLADVTRTLAKAAQCQPSLAAAAFFSHAAAAVQAIADVRTPLGKLLTTVSVIAIADSSEGKSLVWREAQRPFADYNEWLAKEGEKIEIDYAVDLAIWKDEYDRIGQTDKMQLSKEQMREKAERMKECMKRKPKKPSFPTTTFDGGGTVEGIIRDMTGQPPTAIHSTSEGGQFFRGAAFTDRNSASSGSMIVDLIDSGSADRSIMGDGTAKGRIRLRNVRLSQCVSVQPKVILPVLKNEELAAQGLPARYIKVMPEPIAHERVRDSINTPNLETDASVAAYNKTVMEMLHAAQFKRDAEGEAPHPLLAVGVEPMTLRPTEAALKLSDAFDRELAPLTAPGKRYANVKEVALKAAERAIRFAGVLYVVDAFTASRPAGKTWMDMMSPFEIGPDVVKRAITLAKFFLEEERRYHLSIHQIPESRHERLVLDWLRRAIENPRAGWKPTPAEPDGWYLTRDDRNKGPGEMRLPEKEKTAERDAVWKSMFEAMASAEPARHTSSAILAPGAPRCGYRAARSTLDATAALRYLDRIPHSLQLSCRKVFRVYQAFTLLFGLFLQFLQKRRAEPGGGAHCWRSGRG